MQTNLFVAYKFIASFYGDDMNEFLTRHEQEAISTLLRLPEDAPESVKCAALLNDVCNGKIIEPGTLYHLGMPSSTISIVAELTREKKESTVDYLRRISGGSIAARLIMIAKLTDRIDRAKRWVTLNDTQETLIKVIYPEAIKRLNSREYMNDAIICEV